MEAYCILTTHRAIDMKLGNTITLLPPKNPEQTKFVINEIKVFVECIRVLAHRVKNRQRTYVIFVSEEEFEDARRSDDPQT